MKKFLTLILTAVILLGALVTPSSASLYIEDRVPVFDFDQEAELLNRASLLRLTTEVCAYILVVEDYTSIGTTQDLPTAAEDFYITNDLGHGPDRDGIIMLISTGSSEFALYGHGRCEDLLTYEEEIAGFTEDGTWYGAADRFLSFCEAHVSAPEAGDLPYISDQADLLTDYEEDALTLLSQSAAQTTGCGIYILTLEDYHNLGRASHIEKILKDHYLSMGYGLGENNDGMILMLSMKERDFAFYTNGQGDTLLTDPAKDFLVEAFLDDFSRDMWYNGFADYISTANDLLSQGLTGVRHTLADLYPGIRIAGTAGCFLIALLIATLILRYFVKQMKSVALGTEAYHFIAKDGLQIISQEDRYTHTTTTRVYDPPSQSSGSSGGGGSSSGSSRSGKF